MRHETVLRLAAVIVMSVPTVPVARERALVDVTGAATASVVSAEELEQLPSRTRDLRLLLSQPAPFDEVTIGTDKKHVAGSESRVAPDAWTCIRQGGSWSCSGPPVTAGSTAHFAFLSPDDVKLPDKLDLELRYQGQPTLRQQLEVRSERPGETIRDLEGILDLPAGVTPGDPFLVSPASDLYRGGRWGFSVDGTVVDPLDPAKLDLRFSYGGPLARDRWWFQLPTTARADSAFSFTYDNPWGDRVVEAAPPSWFSGPWGGQPCFPQGLTSCQERVTIGSSICVCGCFRGPAAAELTLDGTPIPMPSAMSSRVVRFQPPELAPGTHVIAWPGLGQSVQFEAIVLAGAIAQDKLKVGQSTELGFELSGTEQRLPLEIVLESGGVRIQGGNRQVAHFKGGAANTIDRNVLAVAVGDFSISYTLALPPCPCGGYEGPRLVDDAFAIHPLSASGSADTTLIGSGLRFPMTFQSDSIVTYTPRPPFEAGAPLELRFGQLGLRAKVPGYGDLLFEQRADQSSVARLKGVQLGTDAGFASGDADLTLRTEFSTPLRPNLPFKLGGSYEFTVDRFDLGGSSPGLGGVRFEPRPDARSTIRFYDLQKDAAGSTMFGNADFNLGGRLSVGGAGGASSPRPVSNEGQE